MWPMGSVGCSPIGILLVSSIAQDRKSTRLNSSHSQISYAVFCLKKKNNSLLFRNLFHSLSPRPLAARSLPDSFLPSSDTYHPTDIYLAASSCLSFASPSHNQLSR